MEELKELSQKTKEYADFLRKQIDKVSALDHRLYIAASDEENLRKKVSTLNLEVAALEKEKQDLKKFLDADAKDIISDAKNIAKTMKEQAEEIMAYANAQLFEAHKLSDKYGELSKCAEVKLALLGDKESKLKILEQALKEYA